MKRRPTLAATDADKTERRHGHSPGRCLHILRQLSAYIDDELPSQICKELRRHFGACPNCEVFVASLRDTVTLCRHRPTPHLPASERSALRRNILQAWKARAPLAITAFLLGFWWLSPAAGFSPGDLDQGRAIYERHCAGCHGSEGRGDGKLAISLSPRPGNLISAQTSAKSDRELLNIIANGRPRTAMAGWKDRLSEDEQRAVLAYLRSLVKFTHSATPPPPQ